MVKYVVVLVFDVAEGITPAEITNHFIQKFPWAEKVSVMKWESVKEKIKELEKCLH